MKKKLLLLATALLTLNLISAINLDVAENPISDIIIMELDRPAVFEINVRNLGESSNFEIYSVAGLDISPDEPFFISSGDKKTIRIEVKLRESLKSPAGLRSFEYKIKNSKNEIQEEQLTLNLRWIEEALKINFENVNPKSKTVSLTVQNKQKIDFEIIKLKITSAFFVYQTNITLGSLETKEIQIPIDSEKMKTLTAGNYLAAIDMTIDGKKTTREILLSFFEQEGIETEEKKEGVIIKRAEITKKNIGNVRKEVEIKIVKNILSYFFTTMNIEPTETDFQIFKVEYIWKKQLTPSEEIKIILKTNWFYPILIILLIISAIYLIKLSVETDLMLRKKVSFVKTRGGQFALKVSLRLKAKKFIEKINISDKLPSLVELYDRFGALPPDKIDLKNRRLEWSIESLMKDEERIFTYIIYSKVGIVGRFELPEARATYEKDGKAKSTTSNRSFYVNESALL